MGDWNVVNKMRRVTNFNERWKELQRKYVNHPTVMKYLKNTWEPLKGAFVSTWTLKVPPTSKYQHIQGGRQLAASKGWLIVSTLDLNQVQNKVYEFVEHQERELRINIGDGKVRKWLDLDGNFMIKLLIRYRDLH